MSRLTGYFLVCALGAGAAIALVSCGGGGSPDLLPGNTAREISANLDAVEQLASEGNCIGAQDAAQQIGDQIAELGEVDQKLKAALRQGAARLDEVVVANCSPEIEESIAPASIPETTEGTTTEKTEKKPPKKPAAEETETAPTTPTTTTPTPPGPPTGTPPETVPPEVSGGAEAPPGGVGPGSAEEGQ
jgi:hypothetical protein